MYKVKVILLNNDKVVAEKEFTVNFGATGREVDFARSALVEALGNEREAARAVAEAHARATSAQANVLAAQSNVEQVSRVESLSWVENAMNWLTEKLAPAREAELVKAEEAKLATRKAALEAAKT